MKKIDYKKTIRKTRNAELSSRFYDLFKKPEDLVEFMTHPDVSELTEDEMDEFYWISRRIAFTIKERMVK